MKNFFLTGRFYYGMAFLIACMMLSHAFPGLLPIAKTACVLYAVIVLIDIVLVFNQNVKMTIQRETPPVLSLGDDNTITLRLTNKSGIKLYMEVIDELPEQFQVRNFTRHMTLSSGRTHSEKYS